MTDHVTVNDHDATRVITMRRPDKKNALTPDMYRTISKAIDSAQQDPAIRCLIMTGSAGVFTAGNDLKEFLDIGTAAGDTALTSMGAEAFLQSLLHNAKPLVAAVEGLAIGIGTTMMFHCDYVVASKTAMFSTPFVELGLTPEGASSLLAPHLLGHQRAFAMLVMGRALDGEEAQQAGFVNEVVAAGHAETEARKVAREICALPAEAVAISKRLLRLPPRMIEERLALEGKHFIEQMKSDEAVGAFKAFMARKKSRA
jgi:enoyl-CoA hydratase/carnithine racemase